MSGSAFLLAVGALILLSFLSARADPINKAKYHLVGVGNCRGNGGTADKIDSKSKRLAAQKDCEAECDKLANCVGYTFNVGSEFCAIYGAGMDGKCSIADKSVNEQCGTCSVATKKTKDTCGDCSVKPPSGWAETENFCKSSSDAVWTAGVWTAGVWTDAAGDWEGDSQHTTHIHATDKVAGVNCYDKNLHDHQPHCTGAASCQTNFNAKQLNQTGRITCPAGCTYTAGNAATATTLVRPPTCDGTAKDPEATPDCTKAGIQGVAADCASGCTFVEPVKGLSLKTSHDPIIYLDGWQKEKRSWGDNIGTLYPKGTNGACRVEGNGIKPVHSTWCKTDLCVASNGMSVGLQEGCAQACLDTPSGTCVGYAHSTKYCVLYTGLHLNIAAGHPGTGPATPNVWAKNEQPVVPCLSYENPPSCKTLDVAKPNPQYICILLEVGPERWKAYGPPGDREDISYKMSATGSVTDYTDSIKLALRQKMAALSFVNKTATDAADVTLKVSAKKSSGRRAGQEVMLAFVIKANQTTAKAMTRLVDSQVSTSVQANQHFKSKLPSGAEIKSVTPAGATDSSSETASRLNTAEIVAIVLGVFANLVIGGYIAWQCLQGKAKSEAQQMHFAVSQNDEIMKAQAGTVQGNIGGAAAAASVAEVELHEELGPA